MIAGGRVLAVVPARGGSKGIPLKNLREVGGRSLVQRVGDVIREVPEIDRAVLLTDHEAIARAAEDTGISAPFRRPKALCGDHIGDVDVVRHALKATQHIDGRRYQIVLMLQPTSPLRTVTNVSDTLRMLVDVGWDSVWTVSPTDSKAHPLKQLTISGGALRHSAMGALDTGWANDSVYRHDAINKTAQRKTVIDQWGRLQISDQLREAEVAVP